MEKVKNFKKIKKAKRRNRRVEAFKRFVLVIFILAAVIFASYLIVVNVFKIKKITYEGNTWNDAETLNNYIFTGKYSDNAIVFFLKDKYKKKKVIPYVETYSVKVNWPSEIIINIYEKKIMGCINDNGRYMYFDKDGIVVDISDKLLSTIPEVKGVKINNYVLHEKMKMPSDVVLPSVVEIKQQLDKYHMEVDSIVFDSDYAITLKKGDIKILLGKNKYLTEKIYEYSRIAPELVGRKGTLNLEACDGTKKSYPFKPSE